MLFAGRVIIFGVACFCAAPVYLENVMVNQQIIYMQNMLYRHLLSGERNDPDLFLKTLLHLFVKVTGAKQGYIELQDANKNVFWSSMSYSKLEIEHIKQAISKGIIAAVLKDQAPVKTVSAISDPRFGSRESVRAAKIESVLCVPIRTLLVHGVIYLQGKDEFKVNADDHIRDAGLIVKQISPLIDRICLKGEGLAQTNHTADLRKTHEIDDIVGSSKALKTALKTALTIASLDINILLTGETGTGKTQLAEMIHKNSARKTGPFVSVNCAALPETLIENELFGSVKGGHSSALNPVVGKVTAAEKGTLFLDEIGDLPFSAQAKLLQLLHSGFYYPLGSSKAKKADVRILTATNMDLDKAIHEKRFREDLFYRICTFTIHMPALTERVSDIGELAWYFCEKGCQKHDLTPLTMSSAVVSMLAARAWKGNIRQLKHTIEAAVIYASLEGRTEILSCHLFPKATGPGPQIIHPVKFKDATLLFQKRFLRRNLEAREWNISRTARELFISRSQLNHLIKKFQLRPPGSQAVENLVKTPIAPFVAMPVIEI